MSRLTHRSACTFLGLVLTSIGCGDPPPAPAAVEPGVAPAPEASAPPAPSPAPSAVAPSPETVREGAPIAFLAEARDAIGTMPAAFVGDAQLSGMWTEVCVDRVRIWDHPEQVVDPRALQDILCGRRSLADLIDPDRGVAFVAAADAADDGADTETARRVCGDDLAALQRDVLRDLLWMTEMHYAAHDASEAARARGEAVDADAGIHCVGLVCRAPGGAEYDPDRELVFAADPTRGVVLLEVLRVERIAIGEEHLRARNAWVEAQRSTLSTTSCVPAGG